MSNDAASLGKSASSPTILDWTAKWDGHPTLSAAPRWTIGEGQMVRNPKQRRDGGAPVFKGFRKTHVDDAFRLALVSPGPGTHQKLRDFEQEPEPTDEQHNDPKFSLGKLRDTGVPHEFARSVRQASLRSLRKQKSTLLPTSHLTPGPGSYCAYTTFG